MKNILLRGGILLFAGVAAGSFYYCLTLRKTVAELHHELVLSRAEITATAQEALQISYLTGQLSECYEAGESGPDQGCHRQVDPVAALGVKAVPYLLHVIERHDAHAILNASRCLNLIQPSLSPPEIARIRSRMEKIQSRIPKDADGRREQVRDGVLFKLEILTADALERALISQEKIANKNSKPQ